MTKKSIKKELKQVQEQIVSRLFSHPDLEAMDDGIVEEYLPIKAKNAAAYIDQRFSESKHHVFMSDMYTLKRAFDWDRIPKKFESRLAELDIKMVVANDNKSPETEYVLFFKLNESCGLFKF